MSDQYNVEKVKENIVTQQQEQGFKSWIEHINECIEQDLPPFDFLEYYARWCEEAACMNDITSYQVNELDEFMF